MGTIPELPCGAWEFGGISDSAGGTHANSTAGRMPVLQTTAQAVLAPGDGVGVRCAIPQAGIGGGGGKYPLSATIAGGEENEKCWRDSVGTVSGCSPVHV